MILADAVASGVPPDAVSILGCVVSWLRAFGDWLMASRTDSAAWAIAFTINTWAATIQKARVSVYESVHTIFVACKKGIKDAQWIEEAESLTDEEGHKEFRSRLHKLQKYIEKKDAEFLGDTKDSGMLMKRVMMLAALASVLVIIFQRFYNVTLAVLLPYPLFCLWQIMRGRWARFCVWRMRRSVKCELGSIKKRCKKPDDPPSMNELKTKLDM